MREGVSLANTPKDEKQLKNIDATIIRAIFTNDDLQCIRSLIENLIENEYYWLFY
tara:strand:- start:64 stop:228 length:165 start_codon:yes stop_codon:yes gene_type:complete